MIDEALTYDQFIEDFKVHLERECGVQAKSSMIYYVDMNMAKKLVLDQPDLEAVVNIMRMLDMKVPQRDMRVLMAAPAPPGTVYPRTAPAIFDVVTVCLRAMRMPSEALWPATGGPNPDGLNEDIPEEEYDEPEEDYSDCPEDE